MRTIENEFLKVSIADFGAELSGIYDKERKHQVIWQADPKFWNRHAPVLFPFVGKVNGGFYTHKGIKYPMGQHGFARDKAFDFVSCDKNSTVHILRSDESSKKVYPFDFELKITHTLTGRRLNVGWEVKNTGSETMYFSIGGHPAFNCPVLPDTERRNYGVILSNKESLEYVLIDAATGSVDYKNPKTSASSFSIKDNLFDNDALIFDNFQVEKASLTYPDGSVYVSLECKGFPSFGLWSKPDAPYVCLEPWIGRCDNMGFDGELKDKYGVSALSPEAVFSAEYDIFVA